MLADNFVSYVFHRCTQFFLAMRTLCVEGVNNHCRRICEGDIAVLTLHFHVAVFCMNSQFLTASRTTDIMTFWRRSGNHGKLRQRDKLRNLDAVFSQLRIQQRATRPTVDNPCRHFVTTLWTGATWPCTVHRKCLRLKSFRWRSTKKLDPDRIALNLNGIHMAMSWVDRMISVSSSD